MSSCPVDAPRAPNAYPIESAYTYTGRMFLVALNVGAAIAPVLGYLSRPNETSFSEVMFDVCTHAVRAASFAVRQPPQLLLQLAAALDAIRLALIGYNAQNGTSTFPSFIQAGDAAVHGISLAGAYLIGRLPRMF